MARVKIAFMLILFCVCCTNMGFAQMKKQSISVHWGISIPTRSSFIENGGFMNPSLEWNFRLLPSLSTGVSLGYGYAAQKGIGNERVDGDLISGYRDKSLSVIPLLIKFNYFLLKDKASLFSPYMGVGAGVQYAQFDINGEAINSSKVGNWAELFSAQVGTMIYPLRSEKFYFDARCIYQYGGNSWSLVNVRSIQSFGFTLGAGFVF